ncbi:hypothetical protein E4T48_00575 [Aureobasidium sp. EXF-10727]|nr:hypothetical protein E4T48_00575 [Aureobasidium sp. EXF-10727]
MIARVDETEPSTDAQQQNYQDSTPSPRQSATCAQSETPVLIVGAGPAGLLQAYLLSQLGVRCTIIERYSKRLAAPKAHALSPRSLEICRQFGLDTKLIRDLGTPRSEAYWVNFVTNLSGEHIGRLPYERMDVAVLDDTPEMIHNIPQPTFEEFISNKLSDNVRIIRNASFVSCQQDTDCVTTIVEDRNSGATFKVKSQHVIACDGARSRVRSFLNIECDGEDSYETMMTIHFNADLRPVLGQDRLGMLHWVMDPLVSGFLIGYDLSKNQVLICNFDVCYSLRSVRFDFLLTSQKHPIQSWDENLCRKIIDCAIGQKVPYEVLSFRPWVLSRKVARQYRRGRVFLALHIQNKDSPTCTLAQRKLDIDWSYSAGDAAHSFPPTGGLGLNSGLGDVHNLAYKIAAVHQGWAKDAILDTYFQERRHVAEVNSQQSVKNGKRIFSLLKALGANHPNVDQARQNLLESLHSSAQRTSIDLGILQQQEHFDNLELHIGYNYNSTAIPQHASLYTPKFVAGARLPHTWIEPLPHLLATLPRPLNLSYIRPLPHSTFSSSRKYSSLDLCAMNAITVLSGTCDTHSWKEKVAEFLGVNVPISVIQIDADFAVMEGEEGDAWLRGTRLRQGSTIIVRPDQHILAIVENDIAVEEKVAQLIGQHLGLV